MEQARSERLLNHRESSVKILSSEAASIRRDQALRTEAIQTITQPGLRLAFEIPFGTFAAKTFSPDGTGRRRRRCSRLAEGRGGFLPTHTSMGSSVRAVNP